MFLLKALFSAYIHLANKFFHIINFISLCKKSQEIASNNQHFFAAQPLLLPQYCADKTRLTQHMHTITLNVMPYKKQGNRKIS